MSLSVAQIFLIIHKRILSIGERGIGFRLETWSWGTVAEEDNLKIDFGMKTKRSFGILSHIFYVINKILTI